MNIEQMQQNAEQASRLLKALAHPERLLLLCQLSQKELCVSEIETLLAIHQPSLSQQLGILRKQGLVATRKQSKKVFYRIDNANALALLNTLYQMYCTNGDKHD